ncbi:hypothetical protein DRF62_15530, partial [Chryseobacterium piscium]
MDNQITDFISKITFDQILGFFYFLIPTIIAIWALYFIRKSRFYYVERTSIKLHDDIVKNIPDLAIKYKDSEINENLIFFRGTVLFKSHTDIKSEDIDQEITIYSPDNNALWKHFEISKASDSFQPTFTINSNKVIIDRSMLKINDYITFAGLLDSKNTNLLISHRIFNMVPKSIKFKESDLIYYRQGGIFVTIILGFLLSLNLYTRYQSSKWEEERLQTQKKYKDAYKHADITPDIFDYETFFFNNGNKIKIKKLRDSFKNFKDKQLDVLSKKNSKQTDSLSKIYLKSRRDKDKIKLLNSLLDSYQTLPFYNNPFAELEKAGEKKLDTLLKSKKLKEVFFYKIDDSISVKYVKKDFAIKDSSSNTKKSSTKNDSKDENTKSFSDYLGAILKLLAYFFVLFLIFGMLYFWFMYFTLRRLLKIYKN